MTSPAELAEFDRAAATEMVLTRTVAEVAAAAQDVTRWPQWFPLHAGWTEEPPADLAAGVTFGQQIKVMGIPAEVQWSVARIDETSVRLDGAARVGATVQRAMPDAVESADRALGATPNETVVSARFGGDAAQLMINEAAAAISRGAAEIVLVTGAEGIRAFAEHRPPVWTGR